MSFKPAHALRSHNPLSTKTEMPPAHAKQEILRLASDPTTPAETLTQLAESSDATVCYQIAINPNTPEPMLRLLWASHPLATLENPILAYRALTTNDSFHKLLAGEVKLALYDALRRENRHQELEAYLPEDDRCKWLRYHQDDQDAAKLPSDLLDSIYRHLATDPSANVRMAMLDRLPTEQLHLFATDADPKIRIKLADKAHFGGYSRSYYDGRKDDRYDALINILYKDPDQEVRVALAASDCLSTSAHVALAKDSSFDVRKSLAAKGGGRNLDEVGWRILIKNDARLAWLVASNSYCPEAVRLDLTGHPDAEVRAKAWTTFSFKTSLLTDSLAQKLDALFSDPLLEADQVVLAENRTITAAVISRLMGCSASVTRVLAANKNLTADDRAELLQNEDPQTAANAVKYTDSPMLMRLGAKHESPDVRAEVAGLVGPCATKLRFILATDPSLKVREAVHSYLTRRVENFDTSNITETLGILSRDPLAKMRAAIVSDRRLSKRDITRLREDPSVRVRLEVLERERWSPTSHYGLLDHKSEKVRYLAAKLLLPPWGQCRWHNKPRSPFDRMAASDTSTRIRQVAAESGYTSVKVLRKLISDKSPEVQESLVERRLPRTKTELDGWLGCVARPLKLLEASKNPYCRAVAVSSRMVGKRRLMRMESDPCWFVRAILAKNGHDLNIEALQRLAADKHPLVRLCANERLPASMRQNNDFQEGADQ
jgi:hypothetical protein